jgi:hypothetical protein
MDSKHRWRDNFAMQVSSAGRRVVIAAYKPKPGCEKQLLQLTREHVPMLRDFGFATQFPALILSTADGTLIEIFEWEEGGIPRAHSDPRVAKLWFRYAELCSYIPLKSLSEAGQMFAEFMPVASA